MAKDYYKTLGVARGASADDIKKAYRRLAHEHHPDKKGGNEAKFKEVNEAYQILSNPQKRAQYDQFGETFDTSGGGAGGGAGFGGFDFSRGFEGFSNGNFRFEGGFDDIFSDIFGARGAGGRRRAASSGADIQVDIEITFEEMAQGVKKTLSLRRSVACPSCSGSGGKKGTKETACRVCGGAGQVRRTVRSFLGMFQQVEVCAECRGKGKVFAEKCAECRGSGQVKKSEDVSVEIPAGIENGQMLSLDGEGEAGEHGSAPGDLLVAVHVKPHPLFERRGNDVLSKATLSSARAALGETIPVETIEGTVSMKIPPGTQSGEVFRIRGKGLRPVGGSAWGKGDHLVTVSVRIPKHLTREERRLFESLRDLES